jgi:hypothetical protein
MNTDIIGMEWDDVDWIGMAEDKGIRSGGGIVNMPMNLRFP